VNYHSKWLWPIAPVAALVVLSACASSAFVSSWQAPDAKQLMVEGSKVAAIVMMRDEVSRRVAEDALVRELNAHGARGVPLYSVLPDANPDNEAEVRAALERDGFDGAVVMRPESREETVSAPVPYTGPVYGGFWGGYYGFGWRSAWDFGPRRLAEVRTYTVVTVETLVYSLEQNKLVWGGKSTTTSPSSVERLIEETASKVAKELERRGLIAGAV
jgi:hypothetical protein